MNDNLNEFQKLNKIYEKLIILLKKLKFFGKKLIINKELIKATKSINQFIKMHQEIGKILTNFN